MRWFKFDSVVLYDSMNRLAEQSYLFDKKDLPNYRLHFQKDIHVQDVQF